ncbi:MAG: glycosyltransferase family 2 protein [Flavobacteriales bacterium]
MTESQFKTHQTAVVILNYNGKHWLEKFLPNVIQHSSAEADVVVVDNASVDDSVEFLANQFPDIQCVVLEKNHGFAGGYNQGLHSLDYTYFVLLNSDVEVTAGWLTEPVQRLENESNTASVQPKILSYNQKNTFEYAGAAGGFLDRLGYAFCRGRIVNHLEQDEGQYNDSVPIFWASGAAMFIKSKVFWEAGGFDESFFAHYEEIDLCWRIKNLNYDIFYEPQSTVYHVGGGTLSNDSPQKTYLNFRNSLAMLYKNLPKKKMFSTILKRLILDGAIAVHMLLKLRFSHFWAVVRAHFAFYGMCSQLKSKRLNVNTLPNQLYACNIVADFILYRKRKFSDLRLHKIKH